MPERGIDEGDGAHDDPPKAQPCGAYKIAFLRAQIWVPFSSQQRIERNFASLYVLDLIDESNRRRIRDSAFS
jgi:hypothetical protein